MWDCIRVLQVLRGCQVACPAACLTWAAHLLAALQAVPALRLRRSIKRALPLY